MSGLKRSFLFFVFLVIGAFLLNASIDFGVVLTPTFMIDGYPLINPSGGAADASSLDKGADGSWERVQDSTLRFFRRQPLSSIYFEVASRNVFSAVKVDIKEDLYNFISTSPYSNIPYLGNTKYAVMDAQYPKVAFLEYSIPSFYISLGRRLFSLTGGKYSFILSPVQPYLDHISFGLNYIEPGWRLGYRFYALTSSNVTFNPGKKTGTSDVYKTIFVHRISYENPFLILGLSELNCVYDAYPTITDFTPFVLWHNQYQEEHSNVMIEVSVEARINNLRLYALYAQDDINMKNEGNNLKPTALGFAFGFDWLLSKGEEYISSIKRDRDYILSDSTLETKGGTHLTGSVYWATNWLYNRRSEAPQAGSFVSDRYGKITLPYRYYSNYGGYTEKEDAFYLGFPYGPGSIITEVGISDEDTKGFFSLSLSLLMRGEITIDTPVTTGSQSKWLLLDGKITRVYTISLEAERLVYKNKFLSISASTSSSLSVDNDYRFYPVLNMTLSLSL